MSERCTRDTVALGVGNRKEATMDKRAMEADFWRNAWSPEVVASGLGIGLIVE